MGLLVSYPLLLLLLLPYYASGADFILQSCSKPFNSTQTQSNINHLLADLVNQSTVGGFATSSSGKGANALYGLAQCRGGVSAANCSTCISTAAKKLSSGCPNKANAGIWYDYCFIRYDTDNFIGVADTRHPVVMTSKIDNTTDPEAFDNKARKLMANVTTQAAVAGAEGLGSGEVRFTPDVTIYGLAQCTRDLQPAACVDCLASAIGSFSDFCQYRNSCRVIYNSCMVRYQIYPFFFSLDSGGMLKNKLAQTGVNNYLRW